MNTLRRGYRIKSGNAKKDNANSAFKGTTYYR
jgi:hypothetical protein